MLESLAINLLATGLTAGTGVGARKVRAALRHRQVSEAISGVATEFNKALEQAIKEENERRDSNELAGVTTDWGAVAEHLAITEAAPDPTSRHAREEIDILFQDEEAAIASLAEAIGAVNEGVGVAMREDADVRAAIEGALTRAYRRAVADFERRVARDEELAAVFEAETNLVLVEQIRDLLERLDTLQEDVDRLLTQDIRNEGFRQLSSVYFERVSPSPETCWQTTFTLADVHAGIPAARSGHQEETTASAELIDALEAGQNRIVVGRPGAGKSTLCKQVALEWYQAEETGPVLYRESGRGDGQFQSTGTLSDAIDRSEGHVLVVVEDAVREAANAILGVIEEYGDTPTVSFLLDARRGEFEQFGAGEATDRTKRRLGDLLDRLPQYQLPAITDTDIVRVVNAFEEATGRTVGRDPAHLYAEITGEDAEEFGAFLLLSFHLPVGWDSIDREGTETGFEAHVRSRYETLHNPGSEDAVRDLSRFDPALLADVGVMVNLLNAAGIGIHPELVHALAAEYGHDIDTHDEIVDIRAALEGWFLYRTSGDEGPVRTTHELWSTLYLRHLAREHAAQQATSRLRDRSEPRVGRCLDALFRLCDDETHREELARAFPDSAVLASIADDPGAAAAEYVEAIFEVGERWPVLAPLFGTTKTARYELPEAISEDTSQWIVTTRGHAHRKRGAYPKARAEYKQALQEAREVDDRHGEARSLNNLGVVAEVLGEYEDAREYYQQSLDILRDIGDRAGEAKSLNNLGVVAEVLGVYEDAREYHQQSLDINRDIGDRAGEAKSLNNLGVVAGALGEDEDAREYYQKSLDILRDIGDRAGEATNLGVVASNLGEYEDAREYHQQSLDINRDIGDRAGEAKSLKNLGVVAQRLGEYEEAREYYQQSLDIFRDLGHAHAEQVESHLAELPENEWAFSVR
ncbi:tetratricopeptide repeat protein [Halorubrum vacuolatum]|uniref:Tfp pilus assembly protein PilF n=1 Tax=Halorubrum vacuolatum TaxID=63740 RepID=A0A238W7E9_HALVU|nr:tetratricopeptide repeat protein [Halorubrum vacuolatum]SNR42438.1 Tfp pilus assembly protein PilF [Halorubrum vacuolatum]